MKSGVVFIGLILLNTCTCNRVNEIAIQGYCRAEWQEQAPPIYELWLEKGKVYCIDKHMMYWKGSYELSENQLNLNFNSRPDIILNQLSFSEAGINFIYQGDTFNFQNYGKSWLLDTASFSKFEYELPGIEGTEGLILNDTAIYDQIYVFLQNDTLKIRLNDALKKTSDIPLFLERTDNFGPRPPILLIISKGIQYKHLRPIFTILSQYNHRDVYLGLSINEYGSMVGNKIRMPIILSDWNPNDELYQRYLIGDYEMISGINQIDHFAIQDANKRWLIDFNDSINLLTFIQCCQKIKEINYSKKAQFSWVTNVSVYPSEIVK